MFAQEEPDDRINYVGGTESKSRVHTEPPATFLTATLGMLFILSQFTSLFTVPPLALTYAMVKSTSEGYCEDKIRQCSENTQHTFLAHGKY